MTHEQLRAVVADKWEDLVKAGSAPPPPPPTDVWLTRKELSARQKIPVATLAQWASAGEGAKYALFGRHARYRLSDVIDWENAQFSGVAS
jgi:hypothetical protein